MTPRPVQREITLHGRRVSYLIAGDGPPVVLIHGLATRCDQWKPVISRIAREFTVVAPDLPGHGRSEPPRGDYSLGANAAGIRDLMLALGLESATVVGHSLGGGIAMQFAYQFPDHAMRLVLVSSGGLGREVHALLRAATLPGSEFVLPLLGAAPIRAAGSTLGALLGRAGLHFGADAAEMAKGYASLGDGASRQTFLNTVRSVIDHSGQRATAVDRLYLAEEMATLVMWGDKDPVIPVDHAYSAHETMPHSRLSIFAEVGHFPQLEQPGRFAEVLTDFINTTEPAHADSAALGRRLRANTAAASKSLRRSKP